VLGGIDLGSSFLTTDPKLSFGSALGAVTPDMRHHSAPVPRSIEATLHVYGSEALRDTPSPPSKHQRSCSTLHALHDTPCSLASFNDNRMRSVPRSERKRECGEVALLESCYNIFGPPLYSGTRLSASPDPDPWSLRQYAHGASAPANLNLRLGQPAGTPRASFFQRSEADTALDSIAGMQMPVFKEHRDESMEEPSAEVKTDSHEDLLLLPRTCGRPRRRAAANAAKVTRALSPEVEATESEDSDIEEELVEGQRQDQVERAVVTALRTRDKALNTTSRFRGVTKYTPCSGRVRAWHRCVS